MRAAIAIATVCLFASGCSSLHSGSSFGEVKSKPPASVIELKAPAIVTEEGATTTFPVGKYKPAYEDEHGYYYEAPSKVMVDDIGVYGFEGGLYLSRDKNTVNGWYLIRPNGRRSTGHFKTLPHYKLIP
jgi:hypothetical protein